MPPSSPELGCGSVRRAGRACTARRGATSGGGRRWKNENGYSCGHAVASIRSRTPTRPHTLHSWSSTPASEPGVWSRWHMAGPFVDAVHRHPTVETLQSVVDGGVLARTVRVVVAAGWSIGGTLIRRVALSNRRRLCSAHHRDRHSPAPVLQTPGQFCKRIARREPSAPINYHGLQPLNCYHKLLFQLQQSRGKHFNLHY